MSEREGTDQPQRYCTNCGAETRPGRSFCASCGERLAPHEVREQAVEGSTSERTAPGGDYVKKTTQDAMRWLRASSGTVGGALGGRVPQGISRRFNNLHTALKVTVVLGLLVLLVLLSPLAFVAGAMFIVVSAIVLVIRAFQKRSSWKQWGAVAAAAIIPTLGFGGISDGVYGTGFIGGGPSSGHDGTANGTSGYGSPPPDTTYSYNLLSDSSGYEDGANVEYVEVYREDYYSPDDVVQEIWDRYPDSDVISVSMYDYMSDYSNGYSADRVCPLVNTYSGSVYVAYNYYGSISPEHYDCY